MPELVHQQGQLQLALQFQELQRKAEQESGLRRSAGVGEPKELTELKGLVQRVAELGAGSEKLADEATVLTVSSSVFVCWVGLFRDLLSLMRLQTIAGMLVGKDGVSTYELLQSNLVSALVRYMNTPARIANFAAAFTTVPDALLILVKRLQEALAKTEKYAVKEDPPPLSLLRHVRRSD